MHAGPLQTFRWEQPYGIADHQHRCSWEGFELWASGTGEWRVLREPMFEDGQWIMLVDDQQQVAGTDLQDAMRRAQAAAMVLHFLRTQRKSHATRRT